MLNKKSSIAIIPARGGSKRIEKKNIKDFCGKPIIKYSIDAAKKSKIFDEVIVSTEDVEIAEVAKKLGASVPSLRSKANSSDHSTLADMMLEEIKKLEDRGVNAEYICLIFATVPTISETELSQGYKIIRSNKFDSIAAVCEFSEPIERALKINNGLVWWEKPKNRFTRTQDLEKSYFDAGRFYWIKVDSFKKNKAFFSRNTFPMIIPSLLVQDIDTPEDWEMMELKYKKLNR